MNTDPRKPVNADEIRTKRALRDIERVQESSEVLGTSSLRRAAEGARGHFSAADADQTDQVEVWGKRIARALALAALIALAVHLYVTYL